MKKGGVSSARELPSPGMCRGRRRARERAGRRRGERGNGRAVEQGTAAVPRATDQTGATLFSLARVALNLPHHSTWLGQM
jgi:hypothetical protein